MIRKAAPVAWLILVLALACPFAHAQQTPAAPAVAQPAVEAPAVAVPAGAEAANPAAVPHKPAAGTPLPAAIAVAGDFVYVVQGNTLYQFAVDGLKLVAQAQLATDKAAKKKKKKANVLQLPNPGLPNAQVGPAQPGNVAPGANPPAGGNQPAPAGNAQ